VRRRRSSSPAAPPLALLTNFSTYQSPVRSAAGSCAPAGSPIPTPGAPCADAHDACPLTPESTTHRPGDRGESSQTAPPSTSPLSLTYVTIDRACPRPIHRHPATAESHRSLPGAVAYRARPRLCLPFGPRTSAISASTSRPSPPSRRQHYRHRPSCAAPAISVIARGESGYISTTTL
jgi:hypothetical protein